MVWLAPLLAAFLLAVAHADGGEAAGGDGYEVHALGSPADAAGTTTPGLVLMGGGGDVDAAFRWMAARAGRGDFLVLRASGTDAYNGYIRDLCPGLGSVTTLIVGSRAGAGRRFVVERVRSAEALFIAGGDQADYVSLWKGTPLEEAIDALAARGVPIGGTSAGLAVLGEWSFGALNGTITSAEALADPFDRRVTLERGFLGMPGMAGIVTDSHFASRDRMGRLFAFLARIASEGAPAAKGIGVDEGTAVVVDGDGRASVLGRGAAYFLRAPGRPEVCRARAPLAFRDVRVYRAHEPASFDLGTWTGSGGTAYAVSAEAGRLESSLAGGQVY